MQKSLPQYLFLIWIVNRYNLLFILPFSVVIMSPSPAATVAWLFTEYDVARGILKFQWKTWEFRATSYSVNGHAIIQLIAGSCLIVAIYGNARKHPK